MSFNLGDRIRVLNTYGDGFPSDQNFWGLEGRVIGDSQSGYLEVRVEGNRDLLVLPEEIELVVA